MFRALVLTSGAATDFAQVCMRLSDCTRSQCAGCRMVVCGSRKWGNGEAWGSKRADGASGNDSPAAFLTSVGETVRVLPDGTRVDHNNNPIAMSSSSGPGTEPGPNHSRSEPAVSPGGGGRNDNTAHHLLCSICVELSIASPRYSPRAVSAFRG